MRPGLVQLLVVAVALAGLVILGTLLSAGAC